MKRIVTSLILLFVSGAVYGQWANSVNVTITESLGPKSRLIKANGQEFPLNDSFRVSQGDLISVPKGASLDLLFNDSQMVFLLQEDTHIHFNKLNREMNNVALQIHYGRFKMITENPIMLRNFKINEVDLSARGKTNLGVDYFIASDSSDTEPTFSLYLFGGDDVVLKSPDSVEKIPLAENEMITYKGSGGFENSVQEIPQSAYYFWKIDDSPALSKGSGGKSVKESNKTMFYIGVGALAIGTSLLIYNSVWLSKHGGDPMGAASLSVGAATAGLGISLVIFSF